jgi:hypothetical protein
MPWGIDMNGEALVQSIYLSIPNFLLVLPSLLYRFINLQKFLRQYVRLEVPRIR